jgi:hypothetical protein
VGAPVDWGKEREQDAERAARTQRDNEKEFQRLDREINQK